MLFNATPSYSMQVNGMQCLSTTTQSYASQRNQCYSMQLNPIQCKSMLFNATQQQIHPIQVDASQFYSMQLNPIQCKSMVLLGFSLGRAVFVPGMRASEWDRVVPVWRRWMAGLSVLA